MPYVIKHKVCKKIVSRRMKGKSVKFTSYIASTHECCIAIRIVRCVNVLQTRNNNKISLPKCLAQDIVLEMK